MFSSSVLRSQRRHLQQQTKLKQLPFLSSNSFGPQQQRLLPLQIKMSTISSVTSSHYGNHSEAGSYENAYFYEPGAYMEHLVQLCRNRLQIRKQNQKQERQRKHCILDIGGGTGNFAQILVQNDDDSRIVVIDPFLDPITTTTITTAESSGDDYNNDIVSFIKAPAEDFLTLPSSSDDNYIDDDWRTNIIDREYEGYDQLLLKEVIHHFNENDRTDIFRGMREGIRQRSSLSPSHPSILIITRPHIDIDYPLWDEAKEVWKKNQPSIHKIENELNNAGFRNILWNVESYPCCITLKRWQYMIQSRFWSTFSNFTDDELEEACKKIADKAKVDDQNGNKDDDHDDDDDVILRFEDRLIFLTAS